MLMINYLETIEFIILISTKREIPLRTPIKTDAFPYIICPAAFVNASISLSELSYSMLHIIVPTALIFVSSRRSVDARSVLQSIFVVSLVKVSVFIYCESLAMRQIFKKITSVPSPISANDCSSDLLIFDPFS
jgi:hypothetical protein